MLDGASGTVRMVEIKPKPTKPKCCRNLFGSPSENEKEQMKKIYSECMKEDITIAKEKYDFDIVSDIPLSDRWEITSTAPEFYSRLYVSKEERMNQNKRKMENNETESAPTETGRPRVLKQPPVTNYLKKRKRSDISLPSAKQLRLL